MGETFLERSDLSKALQDAKDTGYNLGHSQGYNSGYSQGYNSGYNQGLANASPKEIRKYVTNNPTINTWYTVSTKIQLPIVILGFKGSSGMVSFSESTIFTKPGNYEMKVNAYLGYNTWTISLTTSRFEIMFDSGSSYGIGCLYCF